MLGGSTSVNAMMYVRGNRRNYDMWNALGADGWSYDDVLPIFKALENYAGGESEYHGVGGPIPVVDCPDPVMVSEEFMVGATEVGYDGPYWDTNGAPAGERRRPAAVPHRPGWQAGQRGHRLSGPDHGPAAT